MFAVKQSRRLYGKKSARLGSIKMAFGDYLKASDATAVPQPAFGHYGLAAGLNFGMLGNSDVGDCVIAGAMHETMVWTHRSGDGAPARFTDSNALAEYSAITGYDPRDPNTDQGTDMQAAASYRRKTGIVDAAGNRHKVDAYASLRRGDADQLARAVWLFGAVGIGLQMPDYTQDQFDAGAPWHPLPTRENIEGLHYVCVVGGNSKGSFLVVTWGRLHAMTPDFYDAFNDESVAYLTSENLRNDLSPEGFDLAKLRGDLADLTGEKTND